ncbi:ATP-binding protein [Bacteroides sp.]|uniref:ATP-binding protein n=1 Tax=Bacteroides sp. TaxID=29523 RepID=UPI003D099F01
MVEVTKHKFISGAMSIIQMGEEQIGHPSTAINELVKNAYDADADKCWVYTQYDIDKNKNFILIKDNGLGMSNDILFGNWLITSRSTKRDEDRDKRRSLIYERRFLGSKGIGRLAAMALGRYLTIITKQKDENLYNWLRIDREVFKVESLLDDITFSGGQIDDFLELFSDSELLKEDNLYRNGNLINILSNKDLFPDFSEGTLIILQDVDNSIKTIIEEETNLKDLEETSIYKGLVDLVTPLKLNEKIQKELVKEQIITDELKISNGSDTFELFYGINFLNEEDKINFIEVVPSKLIDYYDYRVFGKVTENSSVVGKYICKRVDADNRNEDLHISSEYLLSDEDLNKRSTIEFEDIPTKYREANVGEFYFDIRIYDLDDDSKDKMVEILKANGRREAIQIMGRYLGLKVSKNGFGVKPYGEEEQDWLGLGAQRVKKHIVSIGPNQILGYTFLYSPQNDGLSEKTNREGFFENKAFIVFKKIISGILEETGQRRAKYRLKHNLGRSRVSSKLERPDTEKFIQYILSKSNDQDLILKTKAFVQDTSTALDNMESTLSFSQRLASIGTGVELIYHELSQPISALGANTISLNININKIPDENLKKILQDRVNNIGTSVNLLETLRESLKPAIGKSLPKKFQPIETFKKVCYLFEHSFLDNDIIIEIKKNTEGIEIRSQEYVFWISFLNIINNANYWLRGMENRKIIIFEYEDPNKFVISNTGPKIPEEDLDLIFEYGITGKKERNATGLGLSFTRNMLLTCGYKIWAENREYGPAFYIQKELD